jgi:LysM repeat protein
MNKPNPLVPQGTFADKGKSHIRITVFAILAVHVVLLGVLLIAGCNKKDSGAAGGEPGLPPPVTPLASDSSNPPPPWPGSPPSLVPTPGSVVAAPLSNPPPPFPPEPATAPASTVTEHIIMKGDSFYTLGKQYKVGYKAIADANPGVDSTRLKIGQKVKIPAPKPPAGGAAPGGGAPASGVSGMTVPGGSAPAGGGGEKTYTVKSGDNLIKIAKAYGVTPKELQSANNLPTTKIRVGQKLKVPGKAALVPPEAATPPPGTPGLPDGTAAPGSTPVPNRL